jgi:DNA polymerase elongation subunit (family B)
MDYLWQRVCELNMDDAFSIGLGRLSSRRTTIIEQKLASSALGENILRYIDLDGIVSIDMLKVMQRDQKLDSFKLDNVAQVFLGDKKNDLSPKEIFEKYLGSSSDRCEIAKYCIQDCALVNRLMHKLKVLENNIGMGNVCSVPLSYLFMRGQGVKIFSLVAKECRAKQYLFGELDG